MGVFVSVMLATSVEGKGGRQRDDLKLVLEWARVENVELRFLVVVVVVLLVVMAHLLTIVQSSWTVVENSSTTHELFWVHLWETRDPNRMLLTARSKGTSMKTKIGRMRPHIFRLMGCCNVVVFFIHNTRIGTIATTTWRRYSFTNHNITREERMKNDVQ
jgi:hypothetical protein